MAAKTREEVDHLITQIISDYDFPIEVLKDVNKRLHDSNSVQYAEQQLRYLVNVVEHGLATPRIKKKQA